MLGLDELDNLDAAAAPKDPAQRPPSDAAAPPDTKSAAEEGAKPERV